MASTHPAAYSKFGGDAGLCGLFQHTQIMKKRQIATNFGPKTVDAYDEFELFGESFFLNKHQGKWGVTHTKTGASASTWCKSKKAAIDEARGNFERAFKSGATMQSILAECKPLIPA